MDTKEIFNANENYLEWAKMHMEHDRYERADTCALIAQAMIAERQAAALERIATMLEESKTFRERVDVAAALERIAAVLEASTQPRVSWPDEKKWKTEGIT